MVERTQVLQKNVVARLTREASKAKRELEGYLEDLEMYSKPEFWKAIEETRKGNGKKFVSMKELLRELDA